MWWPPDSDVVATTSLSGGHHIIFSAVVPAGLRRGHRLSIIDFTEDEQLMSVYIYILMVIVTVSLYVSCEAIDG